jgi:hypothetical protein
LLDIVDITMSRGWVREQEIKDAVFLVLSQQGIAKQWDYYTHTRERGQHFEV